MNIKAQLVQNLLRGHRQPEHPRWDKVFVCCASHLHTAADSARSGHRGPKSATCGQSGEFPARKSGYRERAHQQNCVTKRRSRHGEALVGMDSTRRGQWCKQANKNTVFPDTVWSGIFIFRERSMHSPFFKGIYFGTR